MALLLTSVGPAASAQLKGDVGAKIGIQKRMLGERPPGGADAGIGPVLQAQGHLALLPFVRVGAYFGHEVSPSSPAAARRMTFGGLRVKVLPPWPRGRLRAWLFVGTGLVGVYAPSYRTDVTLRTPGQPSEVREVLIGGSGGHFFEIPFGLGASYRLRRPYEIFTELSVRPGIGHQGSVYEAPGRAFVADGFGQNRLEPAGVDRWAVGLSVGLQLSP